VSWDETESTWYLGNWPILTALIMDDYGSLDEKKTVRGNGSIRKKPAAMPHLPLQIPRDLSWGQT
jgi:hypothetical protein